MGIEYRLPRSCAVQRAQQVQTKIEELISEYLLAGQMYAYTYHERDTHFGEAGDTISLPEERIGPNGKIVIIQRARIVLRQVDSTFVIPDMSRLLHNPERVSAYCNSSCMVIARQISTELKNGGVFVTRRLALPTPGANAIGAYGSDRDDAINTQLVMHYNPNTRSQKCTISYLYGTAA